ncbi:tripartite motif-containing protein 16-like [Pempheris klunzingeri]|uniref:tripartite motif-containing protein 16-like n=1 Tax=Pempheris klunzingeri TaxID=3127111 RepID=UPI00397EBAFB
MNCIQTHWDADDQVKVNSCPQCQKIFIPRPVLEKNTMLEDLVEEVRMTGLQAANADQCSAGDVACDVCSMDEHKGHDTVSAATERLEKQKELNERRQILRQRSLDLEKDVVEHQQEMEAINRTADKAVEKSVEKFNTLINLIEKRTSDVKQQIRSQQEREVSQVKELQEKLEQEITKVKRKDGELEELSRIEDHTQFLLRYSSESQPAESTDSQRPKINRLLYFEDMMADATAFKDNMEDILGEKSTSVEPTTRAEFLQYSCQIIMDPNTADNVLVLSEGNRKITLNDGKIVYSQHPDRFIDISQVLAKDGLTGRCYFEVEISRVQTSFTQPLYAGLWLCCLDGNTAELCKLD